MRVEGVTARRTRSRASPCSRMSKRSPVGLRHRDQRRPALRVDRREHRVGGVRLGLVREVHRASRTGLSRPRANTHDLEVRRLRRPPAGLARHEAEAPAVVGAAAARTPPVRLPDLDQRVGHRLARAVEHRPATRTAPARRAGRARSRRAAQSPMRRNGPTVCDGVARASLVAPRAASSGRRARCRTGSRAPAPASSSPGRSAQTIRSRACGSRTELKIGSYGKSGSPGKYICVTSRCGERAAEQREVDVRRPPGVRVVAPRVGAGLDRDEAVAALGVGEAAARRRRSSGRAGPGGGRRRGGSGRRRSPARSRPASRAPAGRPRSSTRPVTMMRWPSGSPVVLAREVGVGGRRAPSPKTGAGRARRASAGSDDERPRRRAQARRARSPRGGTAGRGRRPGRRRATRVTRASSSSARLERAQRLELGLRRRRARRRASSATRSSQPVAARTSSTSTPGWTTSASSSPSPGRARARRGR